MSQTEKRLFGLVDSWTYDPRTQDYPVLKHGVWPILVISFIWLLSVHVLIPRYMANRPPKEFRVTMLVINSLQFSSFLFGLPICLFFNLNSGASFITCKRDGIPVSPFYVQCLLYVAFLYIWWKMLDYHRPILAAFRKKQNQVSLGSNLYRINEIILIYIGFRIQPIGMSMFYPTFDAVVNMYVYLYYTLSGGGMFYVHTRPMRKLIPYLRLIVAIATLIHVAVVDPIECDYPQILLYCEFEVSIVLTIASLYNIYKQWTSPPPAAQDDHKLQKTK